MKCFAQTGLALTFKCLEVLVRKGYESNARSCLFPLQLAMLINA